MDHYEVKLTLQAKNQLTEIVDYIQYELSAPDAAKNLFENVMNSILSLSEMPERYRLIEEEPWRTEGIRKTAVKNFLVYYWIDRVKKKVYVIAVLYARRNQLELLNDMKLTDE